MEEVSKTNFLHLYGHLAVNQLLSDWPEVPIGDEDHRWAHFPATEYLDFAQTYPRTSFDSISTSSNYLKEPSFRLSPVHNMWLTASVVDLSSEGAKFFDSRRINTLKLDLEPFVSAPDSRVEKLPASFSFSQESFDLILYSDIIEHLCHPKKMIQECARLLRPNGRIIVTTDNAMMIEVFVNYVGGYGSTFEPVEHTAAMHADFWRGHLRFFTSRDLHSMLNSHGLTLLRTEYSQCFYDVLFEVYFKQPIPMQAGWKRKVLADTPWLGNDVAIKAQKQDWTSA